jgi:HK97 family phage portal protein
LQGLLVSLLAFGRYYGRKLYAGDELIAIATLNPARTKARKNQQTGLVEFVVNDSIVIPADEIVHITDLRKPAAIDGTSRIEQLRDTFGIGRALDEYVGRYFSSGTLSSGLITLPGELTAEQADRLKDQFERNTRGLRNAHRPNVLTGGAKFEQMSATAEQAQLLESRRFFVEEVARAFNIPPTKLGVTTPGSRAYASIEQDNIDFTSGTLRFYTAKIEEALSKLLPGGAFYRINMDGLLRGDLQSRYSAYATGMQAGFLNINTINRLEDRPSVEGGDVYRVPLANVDLGAASIVEQQKRVEMLSRMVMLGFDPAASLAAVGLPPVPHTGLPSSQLQQIAQIDPADPLAAYPVEG